MPAAAQYITPQVTTTAGAETATINGTTYTNFGLVGVGRLAATAKDFLGDTLGSMSGMAVDAGAWRRDGNTYSGRIFVLPDRGLNDPAANVFSDYAARVQTFDISLTPYRGAADLPASTASQNQLTLTYRGGTVLSDENGVATTGVDPGTGVGTKFGQQVPVVPAGVAGARKLAIDAEAIAYRADGSFYVSDEYRAGVYLFDKTGKLTGVLNIPQGLMPQTAGQTNFNSLTPPTVGRRNNQGLENMTITPDGKRLVVMMQSALIQDNVNANQATRNNTRMLVYDISSNALPDQPIGHYVVQLPTFKVNATGTGVPDRTAAASEMLAIDNNTFLLLSRDGIGLGVPGDNPIAYKNIQLVTIGNATNLAGTTYETSYTPVAPGGVLSASVTPVTNVNFVNMLNSTQLQKFGMNLNAGAAQNRLTVSEKWESMGLLPVYDAKKPNNWFLLVGNDNDFKTTNGSMQGVPYDAGLDNDNVILVYELNLPGVVAPLTLAQIQASAPRTRAYGEMAGLNSASASQSGISQRMADLRLMGGSPNSTGLNGSGDGSAGIDLWIMGQYSRLEQDASQNLSAAKADIFRGIVGGEVRVTPELRLGAGIGRTSTDLSFDGLGKVESRANNYSAYAGYIPGAGGLQGLSLSVAYTYSDIRYDKLDRVDLFNNVASGSPNGNSHTVTGEAAYSFAFGDGFRAGPTFRANWARNTIDAYTETGSGTANLVYGEQTRTSFSTAYGAEIAYQLPLSNMTLVPSARLAYEIAHRKDSRLQTAAIANSPNVVGFNVPSLQQDSINFGVGLGARFDWATVRIGYDGLFGRDDRTEHIVTTGIAVSF